MKMIDDSGTRGASHIDTNIHSMRIHGFMQDLDRFTERVVQIQHDLIVEAG
jgi:hypothetical protein